MDTIDREKLRGVIKPNDSWWTTVFPARAANRLVGVLWNTNVTPNQVTLASVVVGFAAAICLAAGDWGWMALGAILIQVSFILDCADGQLARLKNQCSPVGGWLDTSTDVFKNFAFFFGLTVGAVKGGAPPSAWAWGFAAYFLSVSTMFLYAIRPPELKEQAGPETPGEPDSAGERLYAWAREHAYWLSFSVPDQLLVISLGALLGIPRITLIVLAVWGAPAMFFSLVRTWRRMKNLHGE